MTQHPSEEPLDERTERELTQLADGTLGGADRGALETRIAASPELAAAFERQQWARGALRGLDLAAPAGLRARIEAEGERPAPRVRRRRLSIAGGLAAAAAAALLAVLVLPSNSAGPSVTAAARLSGQPATQASVPVDDSNPKLLAASHDGVPFPNLADQFGWKAAGSRSDELDGRDTKTVFYERGGRRIGYTIIAGKSISPPKDASGVNLNGVALHTTADGTRQIVTWMRGGKTCVLSGKGVSTRDLLALASWKGEGSVPF
jgi:anti-sigma factor RsiW